MISIFPYIKLYDKYVPKKMILFLYLTSENFLVLNASDKDLGLHKAPKNGRSCLYKA